MLQAWVVGLPRSLSLLGPIVKAGRQLGKNITAAELIGSLLSILPFHIDAVLAKRHGILGYRPIVVEPLIPNLGLLKEDFVEPHNHGQVLYQFGDALTPLQAPSVGQQGFGALGRFDRFWQLFLVL